MPARPVTLFTGQWADMPLDALAAKAASWGYDGLELACWGDHFDVRRALAEDDYCDRLRERLARHGLAVYAVSNHFVGQAVCDPIDARHQRIVPAHVWGDGDAEGVRRRAADEMRATARAARRLGVSTVNGFTGSSIWHLLYGFPPLLPGTVDRGFDDFAARWRPILDGCADEGVRFALEVHPAQIAFDLPTAERALAAVDGHPAFGFNFDPSHFPYQGVDSAAFLAALGRRVLHCHVKDVWWAPAPAASGVFGGHLDFGDPRRYWDFRSPGRGRVDFEAVIRGLNRAGYQGPLSVEWEDPEVDREHGAREACAFVRRLDFAQAGRASDPAFARDGQPDGRPAARPEAQPAG
jgi:sugar phosphate isomerase/epimerase